MTGTQAKWSERVREWRASGKTAEEFSTGLNFEASTLRYWSSRLKSVAIATDAPPIARVVRRRRGGVAPIVPTPTVAPQRELEVVIGGARIVLRRGFDAELLREVAAALGSAR